MRNAKRNRIKVKARKSSRVTSAKVAKTPEERAIALYFQCRAHTAEGNATNSKRNARTAGKSRSRIPATGRLPQEPNEGSNRQRRGTLKCTSVTNTATSNEVYFDWATMPI